MSHESSALDTLKGAANAAYVAVANAARTLGEERRRQAAAGDLVAQMQACARMVLDLAALAEIAKAAEKGLRDALAGAMSETGCTEIDLGTHTAGTRDEGPQLIVTDEARIGEDYWVTNRAIDRMKLRKALAAGRHEPGATLTNSGRPVLVISSKRAA